MRVDADGADVDDDVDGCGSGNVPDVVGTKNDEDATLCRGTAPEREACPQHLNGTAVSIMRAAHDL